MSVTTAKTTRARGRVRVEHGTKRVRAYLGGELVADTTRPLLVWERPYYPTYYFPLADVRPELLSPEGGGVHSPSRGDGCRRSIGDVRPETASRRRVAANDDRSFEQLFEQVGEAAFILDPVEGRILAANPAACAMLGYTLEELLATPVSRIHPGDLPQLQDFVGRVLREGHGSTITLTCRTRSGEYLPTEMMLWPFGGGKHVYVLALVRDRSEHRARRRGD